VSSRQKDAAQFPLEAILKFSFDQAVATISAVGISLLDFVVILVPIS
jgi:hypothetical protein